MTTKNACVINASHFVFVHFNVKIDQATSATIERDMDELAHDLRAKALGFFNEIICHHWQAGTFFKKSEDDERQMLHYIVVDAPNIHPGDAETAHRMDIFVDGVVKAFLSRYVPRI